MQGRQYQFAKSSLPNMQIRQIPVCPTPDPDWLKGVLVGIDEGKHAPQC